MRTPPTMPRILIVDDQERIARAISILLELHGFESVSAHDAETAIDALGRQSFDLVIQDMNFTPGRTDGAEGLELFRRIRSLQPRIPILLMTAWATVDAAVRLMREGAADYIEKPWDDRRLIDRIRELLDTHRTTDTEGAPRAELATRYDLSGLQYASAAMHEVVSLAARVAKADVPVLITGPNGTGKERIAELIQANSPRRDRPFVRVNAGALPESLIEAELFGADAGAFTGAGKRRQGRFEAADGGTLLLDEIGNLPLAGQIKLLRVLESGELERLGSSKTLQVDVRILAATNSDLPRAIAEGSFREDLYFRLAVIEIEIPSLAQRHEDIPLLADYFLQRFDPDGEDLRLSTSARQALFDHPWPGNVRELRNRIQRAALVALNRVVQPEDLGLGAARTGLPRPKPSSPFAPKADAGGEPGEGEDGEERRRLEATLADHGGVVSHAARSLRISRQALYRRMERLGIVLERRPRS